MKKAVEFREVSYSYPDMGKVLDGLSLEIRPGELVLVAGSSGCGKSTLLRSINGLVPHFSGGTFGGSVRVFGKDTLNYSTRELSSDVGFVFQDPENQFIMSSVESEIAFGLENMRLSDPEIDERMNSATSLLDVGHLIGRNVASLSGGEKQKTILASVLAMKPKVLVLDEPTSQLDPPSAAEFLGILSKLNEEGMTVILSEHRIERVLDYTSKVFDMDALFYGPPEDAVPKLSNRPSYTEFALLARERGHKVKTPATYSSAVTAFRKVRFKAKPRDVRAKAQEPAVEVRGLVKSFCGRRALSGVDMRIRSGEFLAVVGPNGSGKTTLVKHFNGIARPDSGDVFVCGGNARDRPVEELARTVGYVSQNPNDYLFSENLAEELRFSLENIGVSGDVAATLEYLGLSHLSDRYPRDLSGGERQLAAIASVLVSNPRVLVFDEPTRGVDSGWKKSMMGLLTRLWRDGKTIVIVTHDMESVAPHVKRVCLMEGGRIVCDGPTRRVLGLNPHFQPTSMSLFPGMGFLSAGEALDYI